MLVQKLGCVNYTSYKKHSLSFHLFPYQNHTVITINLNFYLSFVDGCLYYLYVGYRNRKLTIFPCQFQQKKTILLVKFHQIEVLSEYLPYIKQNSFPINVSIYSKRVTKPFYQKLVWETIINFCFR